MNQVSIPAPPPAASAFQMLNLNEVRISGRLTQDPSVHSAIVNKVVVQLNVAVQRKFKDSTGKWRAEVAYVPVTAWNDMADYCQKGLRKGSPLYIEGRLQSVTWKTVDGRRQTALQVQASRVQSLRRPIPLEVIPADEPTGE